MIWLENTLNIPEKRIIQFSDVTSRNIYGMRLFESRTFGGYLDSFRINSVYLRRRKTCFLLTAYYVFILVTWFTATAEHVFWCRLYQYKLIPQTKLKNIISSSSIFHHAWINSLWLGKHLSLQWQLIWSCLPNWIPRWCQFNKGNRNSIQITYSSSAWFPTISINLPDAKTNGWINPGQ